ncbi:MAG: DUF4450 domain-containing protein [Mediterranea sp.]|jgi:hypothetical protein|nr:DUF4450 domain-containing protein [Mediterranea sp.]
MNKLKLAIVTFFFLAFEFQATGKGNRNFDIILSGDKTTPRVSACAAPEFSFHLPQMAGNFRIGIANGEQSRWGDELKEVTVKKETKKIVYTLKDPLLNKGSVIIRVVKLTDSDGIVVEVDSENIPGQVQLVWSFGGCYGKVLDNRITESQMKPEYCKNNVFSTEGTAFTAYYGESMRLRTMHGVTPFESEIRLSDAHRQQSPLVFFQSGKETDAPALVATCPVKAGKKLYFCFYTQNKEADYYYYMLPALFEREFGKK